jgi:predicted nucleic acid-binding protein
MPALVLYEWRRGPRLEQELAAQEALFPSSNALPFGPAEADLASQLYGALERPRNREIDLAIAAHTILQDATLWTLNERDFEDIPGLELVPSHR